MRWWLALAFAGIAALTALAVAQVFTARSESAIRDRAQELVAGAAVAAAAQIPQDATAEEIRASLARFGTSRQLALFAFAPDGELVTPERAGGVAVEDLSNVDQLLATALEGRRAVESVDDGRVVTVALPLRRDRAAALIAVASRSDLEDAVGIVREEIVSAAIWATAIGAVAGLVVALLITRRLRRIAAAAAEIEQGRFDRALRPRFRDELGTLEETIDGMRERLRDSFERLEGERDRLRRLLEQLQEGVIAVDHDLTVEFANSRARELLDSTLAAGRTLPDPWAGFPLRAEVRAMFVAAADGRSARVDAGEGKTYVVAFLPPRTGSLTGVVVVTDVTEQERRERAEREFVTNAAHELRTPLAAIATAVEVLQGGAKERSADRDRFLGVVERQTSRLTRLANALLTLARAQTRSEPIRLEPVELGPVVREAAQTVEDSQVEIEMCCQDAQVLAHRELLQQALDNLIANARKHAPDAELTLRVAHTDGRVRIEVADTGPGMTQHQVRRALDRFFRADGGDGGDGESFGLGLPIVREVVAAMGGMLTIDSKPEGGTRVSIVLPNAATRSCQ
jgi:signal transduction histidine kinase